MNLLSMLLFVWLIADQVSCLVQQHRLTKTRITYRVGRPPTAVKITFRVGRPPGGGPKAT